MNALSKRHMEAQEREDFRSALICAVLANINRDPKKSKTFTPQDFMPQRREHSQPEKLTPDQLLEQMILLNAAAGGKMVVKNG